jgi:Tfp pilus assembly protein PilF
MDTRGKIAWHTCEHCETHFTGSMRMGMAQAWIGLAECMQKDEPIRLSAENNYAAALCANGEVGVAEAICRAVLKEQRRICGEDHPDVVTTAENLASCLYRQGKHEEAEAVFREVLSILKRTRGENHPDTLNTIGTLALCLFAKDGRLAEAEALYEEFQTAVQVPRLF